MTFSQLRWTYSGWAGGNGYLYFRFRDALGDSLMNAAAAAARAFLVSTQGFIPSGNKLTADPTFNVIQDADGVVTNVNSYSVVPAVITGTGGSGYSSVAGCAVVWRTSTVRVRRLAMGRTFIVPLAGAAYGTDGMLQAAARTTMLTAANTFVNYVAGGAPGRLVCWKRPSAKGATDGAIADVTGAQINANTAELKSRRPG